jgi:hypothetical protein
MRSCSRAVAGWLLAVGLLGGCAHSPYVVADPDYRAERGRSGVLVLAAPREGGDAEVGREMARLFTTELGSRWFNVVDLEFVLGGSPDLGRALGQMPRQYLAGERVDARMADQLFRRHGIGQLLIVDVFRREQYWGRETKITRVGVEARLVQVAEGRTLWQGRFDPESSDAPGSGFDAASRRAVRELVRLLSDGVPEWKDTPPASWPILEHFTPN